MPKSIKVPTIPNSPLITPAEEISSGEMLLRFNKSLQFVENCAFDENKAIYDDNYQNSQAHSKVFLDHMGDMFKLIKKHITKDSLVVEVGCGKGDFFELLAADGSFNVLGYDATYGGNNPLIEKRYLSREDKIDANFIIIRHVLEHIQNPHRFLTLMQHIFGDVDIYIEVPNYDWIIENQAFYDITYEHVNYFSQYALTSLFDHKVSVSGLCFNDQYQFVIANLGALSKSFVKHYNDENWVKLDFYELFPALPKMISSIEEKLQENSKLYIWGASTKGCMFLVHCLNQKKLIDHVGFAIDINPQKWDRYLPGSYVPIKSKNKFFRIVTKQDVLVIANPNYKNEIMQELINHNVADITTIIL